MSIGETTPKQLGTLGVLALFLCGALWYCFSKMFGGGAHPAPPPPNPAAAEPAPAAAGGAPAGATTGTAAAGGDAAGTPGAVAINLLWPPQLNNPFRKPGWANPNQTPPTPATPPPAANTSGTATTGTTTHGATKSTTGTTGPPPLPAGNNGTTNGPLSSGTTSAGTTTAGQTATSSGGTRVPQLSHQQIMRQRFAADNGDFQTHVSLNGVLVGVRSSAFMTVDGKQVLKYVGDPLPDDFHLSAIYPEGVDVTWDRAAGYKLMIRFARPEPPALPAL